MCTTTPAPDACDAARRAPATAQGGVREWERAQLPMEALEDDAAAAEARDEAEGGAGGQPQLARVLLASSWPFAARSSSSSK